MSENILLEGMEQSARLVGERLSQLTECKDSDIITLAESMRYSLLAGGKRIRPFITLSVAEILKAESEGAMLYACALEMIHTYSLIHDDLPAMDDDDLRRGKPTNHKVYGEARAILAGDALLTKAFETVASADTLSYENRITAIKLLSDAAGYKGMIGGQEMDMYADKFISYEALEKLQSMKTGALIRCAGELGVLSADRYNDKALLCRVREYSELVGRVFQITDDILDLTQSEENAGKSLSDKKNGKITFLSFMSLEKAKEYSSVLTEKACDAIKDIDTDGRLRLLARYLCERKK